MKATGNIVLALVFAAGLPAAYAESHDESCRVTTYFADASMKTQVGTSSTCPGLRSHSGRMTRFAYTEIEPKEPVDPLVHPGSLPCEWPLECANESSVPATRSPETQKRAR
jgi:hypothetical protein